MGHPKKKDLGRIIMDRKIVEGLRSGKSLNALAKITKKSKSYVIKIKDLSLEYGFIKQTCVDIKKYEATAKELPPYPEGLFPFIDGRANKAIATDQVLEPKLEWIKERVEAGWSRQTIFEEIPLSVPRSNFYRFMDRQSIMKVAPSKNVMELVHAPGECLQVDWGKLFDVVDPVTKKKKTVWIFIGILGHSRYEMARIMEVCNYEATITALVSMFEELGGVPRKVTTDNPKVFVLGASEYEPTHNPAFERFASHYGFTIEALPPADPKKKGKVERMVPMKRRLFESYDNANYTLEDAQNHISRKLSLANERKHGTHLQKPIEVFLNTEATHLRALPILKYEVETIVHPTIRRDGYVRFENKYYRVDPRLQGETALVIGNSNSVAIYCSGKLLEVYDRIKDPFTVKSCKDHYKEPWEKTLTDHSHYLQKATEIGLNVERFISIVLARGEGFVDTKVVWGILSLNKKYSNLDVDKACLSALELSQVNLATVRQLLNIMAKPKPIKSEQNNNIDPQINGGKFVRPISEYRDHLKLVYSST